MNRRTWTRSWILTRLICYPLIAASLAVTGVMLANPTATTTEPRVVVEDGPRSNSGPPGAGSATSAPAASKTPTAATSVAAPTAIH